MGGKSNGNFKINDDEHGEFSGLVSLKNNGGFSLLRYRFNKIDIKDFTNIVLRVKGDGNKYQFRIKNDATNYYSYIDTFSTNNEWQNITIPLKNMSPVFRGKKLNLNNFSDNKIEEIAFLIGNKIEQNFKLEIDTIYIE